MRELALTLHLLGVISWMAGILYLIRLYVYHAEENFDEVKKRFIVMERRLYHGITLPAMILSVVAGIWLVTLSHQYYFQSLWFYVKITAAVLMIVCTFLAGHYRKFFLSSKPSPNSRYFRILNEIPTLLMIIIVVSVVYKFQ